MAAIEAGAPLHLPEPESPRVEVVAERDASPVYYRTRNDVVSGAYRVGLGASVSAASERELSDGRFTLDVLPGMELGVRRGSKAAFIVEGGYSYTMRGEHYFVAGIGPMARRLGPALLRSRNGDGSMAVALVPHGLVGTVDERLAAGLRTSVLFHVLMFGVEVAHQYVRTYAGDQHDVRIMFNLGAMGSSF